MSQGKNEPIQKLLVPVAEAAVMLGGLTPQALYQWASQGRFRTVRMGRRLMIPREEIERMLVEGAPEPESESEAVAS